MKTPSVSLMLRLGVTLVAACAMGTVPGLAQAQTATHQVFSFNDLGMHCYDSSFADFAVLPPYNVLRGQVILKGQHPQILDHTQVRLTYNAVADPTGSIIFFLLTNANKCRPVSLFLPAHPLTIYCLEIIFS
jgi:hypothetical protein